MNLWHMALDVDVLMSKTHDLNILVLPLKFDLVIARIKLKHVSK